MHLGYFCPPVSHHFLLLFSTLFSYKLFFPLKFIFNCIQAGESNAWKKDTFWHFHEDWIFFSVLALIFRQQKNYYVQIEQNWETCTNSPRNIIVVGIRTVTNELDKMVITIQKRVHNKFAHYLALLKSVQHRTTLTWKICLNI